MTLCHHGWNLLEATNDVLSGADGNNVRIENTTGPVSIRSDRIAFDGSFNSSSTGRTTIKTNGLLSFEPSGTNFNSDFLGGSDGGDQK